jgi:Phasin protein
MAEKELRIPGPFMPFATPEFMKLAKDRSEALLEMQKEVLSICEQANRFWLEHINREADLSSQLAAKITAAKSMPEVATAYQEWAGEHVKQLASDGESLVANVQRLAGLSMRILGDGNVRPQ